MADAIKTKEMIIEFLRTNGPSLPIQISKHIKMDSLFASAFLSELLREQKLKLSHMKVGTSPVYILPGTEEGMEKYIEYLKGKEREALALLKENKFLEDETQHPAHRVALRQTKDFAIPFKLNDKIIWRYFTIPAQEYLKKESIVNSPESEVKPGNEPTRQETSAHSPKQDNSTMPSGEAEGEQRAGGRGEIKQEEPQTSLPKSFVSSVQQTMSDNEEKENATEEPKTKEEPIKEEPKPIAPIFKQPTQNPEPKTQNSFNNPLATNIQPQTKPEPPKPEFCLKIINIIKENNWTIIEEIEAKKKEYNALVQINSDLGPIIFKLQAKDKKTVGEADMSKLLGEAQAIPLPALFMTYGEVKKKAQEFLDKYISVMKYKQIK